MNSGSKLTFITTSKDKFKETKLFLESNLSFKIDLVNENNVNFYEIQGTSEEILTKKVQQAISSVEGPVLVEDSAFSVVGMESLPGPYIKDFLAKLGNRKLFQLFSSFINKEDEFNAIDKSFIAFHNNTNKLEDPAIFKGETFGKIIEPTNEPKDEYNWCFFFIPDSQKIPYGQMKSEEKNLISARRKALKSLCEYLELNKQLFN